MAVSKKSVWTRNQRQRLAGISNGFLAVASGQLQRIAPLGGRISGLQNRLNGNFHRCCVAGGLASGPINGRKAVESGQILALGMKAKAEGHPYGQSPESRTAAGRIAGPKNLARMRSFLTFEKQAQGGRTAAAINNHNRWHAKRGLISPSCAICRGDQ